jgi:hypothetical protein
MTMLPVVPPPIEPCPHYYLYTYISLNSQLRVCGRLYFQKRPQPYLSHCVFNPGSILLPLKGGVSRAEDLIHWLSAYLVLVKP